MAKPKIHDLDILRPEPEYVVLAGKEIDISFIPSGVAFEIMGLWQELEELSGTTEKLDEVRLGGEAAKKSFDLTAEICSRITQAQHKEMNKEWLLKNVDIRQLNAFVEYVKDALFRNLGDTGENPPVAEQET